MQEVASATRTTGVEIRHEELLYRCIFRIPILFFPLAGRRQIGDDTQKGSSTIIFEIYGETKAFQRDENPDDGDEKEKGESECIISIRSTGILHTRKDN